MIMLFCWIAPCYSKFSQDQPYLNCKSQSVFGRCFYNFFLVICILNSFKNPNKHWNSFSWEQLVEHVDGCYHDCKETDGVEYLPCWTGTASSFLFLFYFCMCCYWNSGKKNGKRANVEIEQKKKKNQALFILYSGGLFIFQWTKWVDSQHWLTGSHKHWWLWYPTEIHDLYAPVSSLWCCFTTFSSTQLWLRLVKDNTTPSIWWEFQSDRTDSLLSRCLYNRVIFILPDVWHD